MDATLYYIASGITYSRTVSLLAIHGMDQPDKLHPVKVVHDLLDGTVEEQVRGFRKEITLSFKPPFDVNASTFLSQWFSGETKGVIYGLFTAQGITDKELASKWLFDMEYGRTFDVQFYDEYVYTRWDDGPILDTDMYATPIVEITGTLASPQTFTTNVAPLTVDDWGNPFPAFNGTLQKFVITAVPMSYAQFTYCQVGEATVSGGNLTWQGYISDFHTPADDGKFYVKFEIRAHTTT